MAGPMNDGLGRRDFLKVIGVTGAGAGLVGCSTEGVEKLMPYVTSPEDIVPGVATWYSSVCGGCAAGCGTRVRTREGRAVLVSGNPDHPVSQGALCARGSASIQGLYHADRIAGPMVRDGDGFRQISWAEAEQALALAVTGANGDVALLTGRLGPSMDALAESFVQSVGGRHVRYDALSHAPLREAARIAFGRDVVPTYDLSEARFLVSFGADFLETWLSPVAYGRGFSRFSGHGTGEKGRFVFVGPRLSLTGQNADEWVPAAPGSEAVVALAMANVIAAANGGAGPYAPIVAAYDPESAAAASGISAEAITALAEQFMAEGPGLAIGPGVEGHHENATATHLAVLVLNAVAGSVGTGLRLDDDRVDVQPSSI
jgi:anaerobic selenocysteine-containing dehydrogenase